jgi:hypothetical protein
MVPVEVLMEAIDPLALSQVPPDGNADKVEEVATHNGDGTVMVPGVTLTVAIDELLQPVLLSVNVTLVVPAVTPVNTPVVKPMVAAALETDHVPAPETFEREVVLPSQTTVEPKMVAGI